MTAGVRTCAPQARRLHACARERGAATVEWTGLVLLVAAVLGAAGATAGALHAPSLARSIRCAVLGGMPWRGPRAGGRVRRRRGRSGAGVGARVRLRAGDADAAGRLPPLPRAPLRGRARCPRRGRVALGHGGEPGHRVHPRGRHAGAGRAALPPVLALLPGLDLDGRRLRGQPGARRPPHPGRAPRREGGRTPRGRLGELPAQAHAGRAGVRPRLGAQRLRGAQALAQPQRAAGRAAPAARGPGRRAHRAPPRTAPGRPIPAGPGSLAARTPATSPTDRRTTNGAPSPTASRSSRSSGCPRATSPRPSRSSRRGASRSTRTPSAQTPEGTPASQ